MKMNKSAGSMLLSAGLTAAAVYAVPAIKNFAVNKMNKKDMSSGANSAYDKLSMR